MPMLTRLHCAITIDVLMRVSLVLTAGLLLALMARRSAAYGMPILVAGLVAAFIVPAAMLTMQVLPVSRLPLDLPGRVGLDDFAAVTRVNSQPPSKPHHDSTSFDHSVPAIASTRGDEARLRPGASVSTPLDERSLAPHASNWLNAHDGQFMATGLLSALLMGAIVKVTGLGFSLLRLRRIVAQGASHCQRSSSIHAPQIQQRIPMRYSPCLLESSEVPVPVAAGVVGDYVVLPAGWAGSLCQEEMLAVLCHESAHLRDATITS